MERRKTPGGSRILRVLSLLIEYPECVEAMWSRRLEPQASEMLKAHLLEMIKPPGMQ
jgi:hypothetical protein